MKKQKNNQKNNLKNNQKSMNNPSKEHNNSIPENIKKSENFISELKSFYELEKDTSNFIKTANKNQIDNEINFLTKLIEKENFDLHFCIFLIETVIQSNHVNLNDLIKMALKVIEKKSGYKYCIFQIRILRVLISFDKFIPLLLPIINILEIICKQEETDFCKKKFTFSDLKVSSDHLKSFEYKEFVFKKIMKLLYQHLDSFSNNIGFPELTHFLMKRLENIKNVEIKALCEKIQNQNKKILMMRKEINSIDQQGLILFNKTIKKMSD